MMLALGYTQLALLTAWTLAVTFGFLNAGPVPAIGMGLLFIGCLAAFLTAGRSPVPSKTGEAA